MHAHMHMCVVYCISGLERDSGLKQRKAVRNSIIQHLMNIGRSNNSSSSVNPVICSHNAMANHVGFSSKNL